MNRRVQIRPKAADDFHEIITYLRARSPAAATRFVNAAHAALERLADMPRLGTLRRSRNPRLAGLRSYPIRGFRNYLAFYRPTQNGIEVLRVYHAARNIDPLLKDER
jgi:toxin ParE1/3/4